MGRTNFFNAAAILVGLVVIMGIYSIGAYNHLVQVDKDIDVKWSRIENQLQCRSDLIPNLAENTRIYAEQEQEIFTSIAESEMKLARSTTVGETAQADADLSTGLLKLLKVVKQHPDVGSDTNCQQLLDELVRTEELLATARREYNEVVRGYNTRIKRFPANVVASIGGFERHPYFEVDETAPINNQ